MIRYILFLFPLLLSATTFNFNDNVEKQANILRKFDVDSSFLNERFFQEKLNEYRSETKKIQFFRAISSAVISLPTIKKLLAESKIPNEFIYLAMAESQLSSEALSRKSAAGMWQFMPYMATRYGLVVDKYVDERLDMVKSTRVAIRFLSDMHRKFGKWYLAAIAYNCGEGTLRKAIRKAGTNDLATLIDPDKKYLPKESRIYIRKILAFALLEGTDDFFGSKYSYLFNIGSASSLITVEVGGGEHLSRIAQLIDMDRDELKNLNSHLLYGVTPPTKGKHEIYIPHYKLPLFQKRYSHNIEDGYVYVVKQGDSLYKIGRKYSYSYKEIKKINDLKSDFLKVGQKLVIPLLYNSEEKLGRRESVISNIREPSDRNSYRVKKGDTLYSIAREFQIDINSLMQKNNLETPLIYIGEELIVE
jgi:membrane-bound lytic murein transglycosylase D